MSDLQTTGDKLAELLSAAYDEARKDPEICTMELAGKGKCWCREVRRALEAWKVAR